MTPLLAIINILLILLSGWLYRRDGKKVFGKELGTTGAWLSWSLVVGVAVLVNSDYNHIAALASVIAAFSWKWFSHGRYFAVGGFNPNTETNDRDWLGPILPSRDETERCTLAMVYIGILRGGILSAVLCWATGSFYYLPIYALNFGVAHALCYLIGRKVDEQKTVMWGEHLFGFTALVFTICITLTNGG